MCVCMLNVCLGVWWWGCLNVPLVSCHVQTETTTQRYYNKSITQTIHITSFMYFVWGHEQHFITSKHFNEWLRACERSKKKEPNHNIHKHRTKYSHASVQTHTHTHTHSDDSCDKSRSRKEKHRNSMELKHEGWRLKDKIHDPRLRLERWLTNVGRVLFHLLGYIYTYT